MSDNQWIEEARGIAARCWCDETTKHLIMEPALAEVFARVIASWMETGAMYSGNADYWRGKTRQTETPIRPRLLADLGRDDREGRGINAMNKEEVETTEKPPVDGSDVRLEVTRLLAEIAAALPAMNAYCAKNPMRDKGGVPQDPNGAHAWLIRRRPIYPASRT